MEVTDPAWKQLGWKSKVEAWKKIIDGLFKHKDSIINRGFSEEVPFTLGKHQIILKGKNPGRKKDK